MFSLLKNGKEFYVLHLHALFLGCKLLFKCPWWYQCDLFYRAQGAVGPVIREEICKEDSHLQKIFLLLCCSDVREAAKLALENDMPQLSLLISQSRSFHMKKHLTQLLSGFCDEDKSLANHINPDVMKIYCLVAGSLSYVGGDWLRQFMIYIVYFTENTYPLTSIIENFEKLLHDGQFEWPYVKHTESPCSSVGSTEARPPLDIIYHILKLAHSISPSLEELLDPITHTPDRLDYRLRYVSISTFTFITT